MTEGPQKKTSVWIYVGCGCLTLIAIVVLAVCGTTYFAVKKVGEGIASLSDPAARRQAAAEILGTETLPEGLQFHMGFSMPLDALQVAAAGSAPPDATANDGQRLEGLGDNGFVYFELRTWGKDQSASFDQMLEGKEANVEVLQQNNIQIDTQEILGRGETPIKGGMARFVTTRGNLQTGARSRDVRTSLIVIDCDIDNRTRFALWYEPPGETATAPAEPAAPVEEGSPTAAAETAPVPQVDLTGTVGDPARVQAFFEGLDVCR